jgi:hypothetical protein
MSDEKKKKAAELRAEQEERECRDAATREEKRKMDEVTSKQRAADAQQAFVQQVRDTWYSRVSEASEHNDVRFCLVGKVVFSGDPLFLKGLIDEAKTDGYQVDLVSTASFTLPHLNRAIGSPLAEDQPHEVIAAQLKGWHPGKLPQLQGNGTPTFVVVRW